MIMHRATARGFPVALAAACLALVGARMPAQSPRDEVAPPETSIASLQLAPDVAERLQRAMSGQDYLTAEKLLLAEIDREGHSARAARLLAYAGAVYFRNRDYMNASIAWKKSEAIAPLEGNLRFCMAMAFIQIGHADWARGELQSLAGQNAKDAIFPYWLGRLSYDGHEYEKAIAYFQRAIELDPRMARAYDNLGLCYYYENQNDSAVSQFEKAIELEQGSAHPSPWPYLNLAVTQQFLNQPGKAEKNLREAIRLDAKLAKAHFQLGTVLEDTGRAEEALKELGEAARLEGEYPEPHMAMARILHKLGREDEAKQEVEAYRKLRAAHPAQ
jgi:tetratricopeptide (TPR) repeat protein